MGTPQRMRSRLTCSRFSRDMIHPQVSSTRHRTTKLPFSQRICSPVAWFSEPWLDVCAITNHARVEGIGKTRARHPPIRCSQRDKPTSNGYHSACQPVIEGVKEPQYE